MWSELEESRWGLLALVVCAGIALGIGLSVPVVYLRSGFERDAYSVLTGIYDLAGGGNVLLALIVFAFSVVFPSAKLLVLVLVLFRPVAEERRARVLTLLSLLGRWSMLDVFVIAILVGAVQLGWLSKGEPRPGLYVFALAILFSMISTMVMERRAGARGAAPDASQGASPLGRCLFLVSAILFLIGLWLPLMNVEKWFFWEHDYSVLGGAAGLARSGEYALAATLLLFVGMLPLARFVGLAWFHFGRPSPRVLRTVVMIDRWAMLDVFVLALLIVLVKVDEAATVEALPGLWVLLIAVGLSLYDSVELQRGRERS